MRLAGVLAALLAALLPALPQEKPKVSREALAAVERSCDSQLSQLDKADPVDLLGNTRGVYLDGYGVVFTTEVSLIITPGLTPFRTRITKEETDSVHRRKLAKLPALKRLMREMLISSAASLDFVPANQQVVMGVTLFYYSWEDRTGLPGQSLLRAPRSSLLAYRLGKNSSAALDAAIRTEEF